MNALEEKLFRLLKIILKLNIQGKKEISEMLEQQEQQASQMEQDAKNLEAVVNEAKLKELHSKAMLNLASARERHGRNESNIGLFEERISEVQKNEALSTKAKMEAIEKMVDVIAKFGEVETMLAANRIESYDYQQDREQDIDRSKAKMTAEGNKFMIELMSGMGGQQGQQQQEQM